MLQTFQHEKAASDVQQVYKKFSTPTLSDHRDYLKFVTNENIQELECPKLCAMERGCQTNWNMREESSQTDINSDLQDPKLSKRTGERPIKCGSDGRLDMFHGSNPLSRERILMLLEQAQINTPLASQRFRQIDDVADIECSPISVCNGRQRQVTTIDKVLLDEHGCFWQRPAPPIHSKLILTVIQYFVNAILHFILFYNLIRSISTFVSMYLITYFIIDLFFKTTFANDFKLQKR